MAATARPAGVDPVRVTAFTSGASMIAATAFEGTRSERKRSLGKPAPCTISSMARAQPDTLEECFSRPALPAMSPGATKRKTCQRGKFQGITARTTPRGVNATKLRLASVAILFRAEEALGFGCVVLAHPSALLGFGSPLRERLSHLEGHEPGQLFLALAQERGGAAHGKGPLREAGLAPGEEGLMRGRGGSRHVGR